MKSTFFKKLNDSYQNQKISPILVSFAKLCLQNEKINQTKPLKPLPHKDIINLIEKFLKAEYGIDFYNQFMNNLFQGQKVILYNCQKDIERISLELNIIQKKYQESTISKEDYYHQTKKLLHEKKVVYTLKKNNKSYVDGLDGTIFFDIKETLEDAFVLLHEGIHRIFTQKNDHQFNSLDEIPSHAIEWQFYFFCLKNNFYVIEAQKYFTFKRNEMIENSTRILFEELIVKCKKAKKYHQPQNNRRMLRRNAR